MQQSPSKRPPPALPVLLFLVVAIVAGAVSGAVVSLLLTDSDDNAGIGLPSAIGDEQLAATVERVLPAVVTIVNEPPARVDEQGRLIGSIAVGSGFIVSSDGYVVTNEHVVHEAGDLTIVLSDGQEYRATLVSSDAPFTDLAVLRIAAGGLTPLVFGDYEDLALGQTLIAIGTALFEYRNSVTVGIVSGLDRRWLREGVYMEDLIQTDAAVNSGNSGGPLITLSGEVVGINSTVVRTIGAIETVNGVAFAISSKTMEPIVRSIIETGSYPRPYFGVDHEDITAELLARFDFGTDRGAVVTRVIGSSPAARAGLEPGDILLRLGETEISEEMPFINALASLAVEGDAAVEVLRDGETFITTVEIEPR